MGPWSSCLPPGWVADIMGYRAMCKGKISSVGSINEASSNAVPELRPLGEVQCAPDSFNLPIVRGRYRDATL